jgi:hypothetical protein
VLYIVASLAGVLSAVTLGSLLSDPSALADLDAHKTQVLATAFLELVMAITVAGVAFMIYPVLKQDADSPSKQGLALWYVGTRITEGALFMVGILALLALAGLSREMAGGGVDPDQARAIGSVLMTASDYSWILGQSVFSVGAVMLYYLLYVSRRVPRWLSIWGLVGAPLMLLAGFMLPFTHDPNSPISGLLYAPLGLQEMALALWLIFKGFSPSAALEAGTASTA